MAAVEADRVIVAIIGDTSKLDGPVNNSARQFDQNMSKIERAATRAEGQIVRSSGAIQNAQRNLGRQIADIGTQVAGGQSPFIILAQQLPQVADAATDMGGKMGRVAAFLTTPWGAAALAATSVLLPLAAGLIKTGNETDELVEKMRQHARQAELTRRAEDAYRITIDGVTESIRKRREEQEKALQTDQQAEQAALGRARGELATQRDNLKRTREDLAKAERDLQNRRDNQIGETRGIAGSAGIGSAQQKVARLRQQIVEIEKSIAAAEASVRGAEIPIGERDVAGRVDATVAATNEFTAALGRLRDERQRGLITQKQFNDQLEVETRRRDAAIKKAQEAQRQSASSRVTLPLPANGPITSGFGARAAPTKGASTFHPALDIGVPVGTQVRAGAPGVVVYSGKLGGLGNVVIVDYGNGTIAEFGHLSQTLAKRGQQINAGDVVALSGNTGVSTGPHLDYRLRTGARVENGRVVGGRYVDPRKPVSVAGGDAIANMEDQAAKSAQKIQDDFDALWDDIQRGGAQASEKIASDFKSLETALDPAAAAADKLAERLAIIEKARLTGIIDDTRAAQVAFLSLSEAIGPLTGVVGAAGSAGSGLGQAAADGISKGIDVATDRARDQISTLADYYEAAFEGGTKSVWDMFKREALRALALLAAQQTFKLITGQSGPQLGGGGGGGILGTILSIGSSIFGRASGGYVGPGSVTRVNENRGGVELLRMGPQGGTVIPLGQAAASGRPGNVTVIQNFTLDARHGITTPQLLQGVSALVDAKAGAARDQAVAISRGVVPKDIAKQNRYGG